MLNNLNNLNIKKISLWLSVTILASFAIATLLFFQIDVKNLKENRYNYDINEEKTFAIENLNDINIDSSLSDINIIEYDDTKVKVHIYGKLYTKNKNEENKPVIELNDGRLDIKESRKSMMHVGINFNIGELFQKDEMKIDLFIPKGYSENIKIASSSGSVKADPLNLKELDIDTFSGDIDLKAVTANKVNLETSSGNVKADPLKLKELDVNTFSGKIELEDVSAEVISLETSSGDISAGNMKANDLKINSFSGNNDFISMNAEKVYFKNSSGYMSLGAVEAGKITGVTFSGDITAEKFKSEDADMSTSSGYITIEGATVKKVKCKTFSGDIVFDNAALNGTEIDTSSGNVTLNLLENSEFALAADSSSGDVECDFNFNNIEKQDEHEIKGVVGKATNKIKVNTFSGYIKISK